jgi:uncharacterized protein YcbX
VADVVEVVGRVESLWRYPVKSMMGEELREAYVGAGGVYGDRRYAFVSSAAPLDFPYFTAREKHPMLLHRAAYRHPEKMVRPNGLLSLADGAIQVATPSGEQLNVDDPRLIELLRDGVSERHEVSLVQSEDAIVDSRPVSLCSLQTVWQLCEEIGVELDKRRFRANIYIDLDNGGGFAEDEWVGRKLRIGPDVVLQILKKNTRCKLITLDPDSAQANPEVMKRVARDHESQIGIYASAVVEGMVAAGEEIALLD